MKQTLKVLSWVQIVLGILAIIGCLDSGDMYGLVGGALFTATGCVALSFIKEVEK